MDDIQEVPMKDIPAEFLGSEIYAATESGRLLRRRFSRWLKSEGIYYYARPRESFSAREGKALAVTAGCRRVLLEDLS